MKHTKRRAIVFVLLMLTVLGMFGVISARAEEEPDVYSGIKSISLYAVKPRQTNMVPINWVSDKKQIKNLKCSNSKVASVSIKKHSGACFLAIVPKKAGKVKISFTAKYGENLQYSKKLNFKVTVLKYSNPCKSFKIGSKQYASLFKNNPEAKVRPQNKKLKISVKPNKGWAVKKIEVYSDLYKKVRNGGKVNMKKGGEICVTFRNKKTKKERMISLLFGSRKVSSTVYWV